jgi:enoyl-CoA hydratase/carnithine racemase
VLLTRAVGPQQAAELLYTSRWVSAEQAVAVGLALRVCPSGVVPAAIDLVKRIAEQPTDAVRTAKVLLRAESHRCLQQAIARETQAAMSLRESHGGLRGPQHQ